MGKAVKLDVLNRALQIAGERVAADDADRRQELKNAERELRKVKKIVRLIQEQFTEGSRDPYPTSDMDPDYLLRNLTGWERKAKR